MLADVLNKFDDFFWGIPLLSFVLFVGIYFIIGSKFFPVTYFNHIMKNTIGNMSESNTKDESDPDNKKFTPFQTICIAIGGSMGVGNIGGVATAIAVGGPGAVFWFMLESILGSIIKIVETSLGCYNRSKNEKGEYYGGSVYYMEKGIGREMGHEKLGKFLAAVFGIGFMVQFLGGSQVYTIAEVLNETFGIDMILVTIIYSLFVWSVIYKGVSGVADFATKCVPLMCVLYTIGGIAIAVINIKKFPYIIALIFKDAFVPVAAVGGFAGAGVKVAVRNGVTRAINSNEAGQGSSPLIHGSADTIHPVRQGLWGSFEVFIDAFTCLITAIAIIATGAWTSGAAGGKLTILAFDNVFGGFGGIFIGIMCILFGIATTTGWFTYYVTIINYGLKNKPVLRDKMVKLFKFVFPIPNLIIVSAIQLTGNGAELFWTIVDLTLILPVTFNIIAIFVLRKKFWVLFKDYKARYLGIGKVDPNFYVFYEDDPEVAKTEEEIRRKIRLSSEAEM
jgi:AGCS family alanine or glycine:cation symporter